MRAELRTPHTREWALLLQLLSTHWPEQISVQATDAGLHPWTGELSLDLVVSTERPFARDWAAGVEVASVVLAHVSRPRVAPGEEYDIWRDPRAIAAFHAPLTDQQLWAIGETEAEAAAGLEGRGVRAEGGLTDPEAEAAIHVLRLQVRNDGGELAAAAAASSADGGASGSGSGGQPQQRSPSPHSSTERGRGRTRSRSEPRCRASSHCSQQQQQPPETGVSHRGSGFEARPSQQRDTAPTGVSGGPASEAEKDAVLAESEEDEEEAEISPITSHTGSSSGTSATVSLCGSSWRRRLSAARVAAGRGVECEHHTIAPDVEDEDGVGEHDMDGAGGEEEWGDVHAGGGNGDVDLMEDAQMPSLEAMPRPRVIPDEPRR